jgi:FkbH-like protein
LRNRKNEFELGRVYFDSYAFHPTRIGVELGRNLYFQAIYASAFLTTKKVVVCDLDNTLWDGAIGEGAVTHYKERQTVLKGLRNRGVLLSINSKNDPKNVHWRGAVLQPDDFVATQINWDSKVSNLAAIRDELNLKVKDFVFIDDRPDELERIQNAFPEILTFNATQLETWKVLSYWQNSLSSEQGEDRTKLYHERVRREDFLNGLAQNLAPQEDETDAFAKLQLSVRIEDVTRSGLKRAAELINRTNQFNLSGSRTTVRELENGLGTDHWVISAAASDKFGSMGVVGVMRVDRKTDRLEIPVFVLSCRVFGFGIEYALLNAVKRLAPGGHLIVGHYRETQSNQPCRQLYPASGFNWDNGRWLAAVGQLPPDPAWLAVENKIAPRLPGPKVRFSVDGQTAKQSIGS